MKKKVTVFVEDDVITNVDVLVNQGVFRNRSHGFEYLIKKGIKSGDLLS